MLKPLLRRSLLAAAVMLASPFALAQAVVPAPVTVQVPQNRPTPAERAALHAAHANMKKAHETIRADFEKLHTDREAHATPAQIALDHGNIEADIQVFHAAQAQWKQTLEAFFAAHPGARERWEQHHHHHHQHPGQASE